MYQKIVDSIYAKEQIKCSHCGKKFSYCVEEQTPGFRFPSDLICPWCGETLRESLEVEYWGISKEDE